MKNIEISYCIVCGKVMEEAVVFSSEDDHIDPSCDECKNAEISCPQESPHCYSCGSECIMEHFPNIRCFCPQCLVDVVDEMFNLIGKSDIKIHYTETVTIRKIDDEEEF